LLQTEIEIIRRINNTKILGVQEIVEIQETENSVVFIMKKTTKKSLAEILTQKLIFSETKELIVFMKDMLEIAHGLKSNNIIHRNLTLDTICLIDPKNDINTEPNGKKREISFEISNFQFACSKDEDKIEILENIPKIAKKQELIYNIFSKKTETKPINIIKKINKNVESQNFKIYKNKLKNSKIDVLSLGNIFNILFKEHVIPTGSIKNAKEGFIISSKTPKSGLKISKKKEKIQIFLIKDLIKKMTEKSQRHRITLEEAKIHLLFTENQELLRKSNQTFTSKNSIEEEKMIEKPECDHHISIQNFLAWSEKNSAEKSFAGNCSMVKNFGSVDLELNHDCEEIFVMEVDEIRNEGCSVYANLGSYSEL